MTEAQYQDWVSQGHQLTDQGLAALAQGRTEWGQTQLALAQNYFERAQDRHWLTYLFHQRFLHYKSQKDPSPAFALAHRVLEGYRVCLDPKGQVQALLEWAHLCGGGGEPHKAFSLLANALALAQAKAPQLVYLVLCAQGAEHLEAGDYAKAAMTLDQALSKGAQADTWQKAWCFETLGRAFWGVYRPQKAERFFRLALTEFLELQDKAAIGRNFQPLLELEGLLGTGFSRSDLYLEARSRLKEMEAR